MLTNSVSMKRESWVAFLETVLKIKYHSSSFLPYQDEYASYWPSCFLKYNLIFTDSMVLTTILVLAIPYNSGFGGRIQPRNPKVCLQR